MTRSIFDPITGDAESSLLPEACDNPPHISLHRPVERAVIDVAPLDGGKVLMVELIGKIHKSDYHGFMRIVEKAVQENGNVRILVQMTNFHGWDFDGLWADLEFDEMHFADIDRLAIVGEATWEKWMAVFCRPFTTATIRYFNSNELKTAKEWITAK